MSHCIISGFMVGGATYFGPNSPTPRGLANSGACHWRIFPTEIMWTIKVLKWNLPEQPGLF